MENKEEIVNEELVKKMLELESLLASASLMINALCLTIGDTVTINPAMFDQAMWKMANYSVDPETRVMTIILTEMTEPKD